MKTVGDDDQVGHGSGHIESVNMTVVIKHGEPLRAVSPEFIVGFKFRERFEDRSDFATFQVVDQFRFEHFEQILELDLILHGVRKGAVCRLIKRDAGFS